MLCATERRNTKFAVYKFGGMKGRTGCIRGGHEGKDWLYQGWGNFPARDSTNLRKKKKPNSEEK